MNKNGLYLITMILLAGMAVTMRWDSRALDAVFGSAMSLAGAAILITDPRNPESKRIGYRTIGIVLLVGGIVFVLLAMYRKFLMPRFA